MEETLTLEEALGLLRQDVAVPLARWPESALPLGRSGLAVVEQFVQPPEPTAWLDAERLMQALGAPWRVEVAHACASTNALLLERAQLGSVHRHLLTAELQTAGRGRRGRSWVSPLARNLAVSIGFASRLPPFRLQGASLAVGLGVRSALDALGARSVGLKWPNDVLADGRKLCGILVELSTQPQPQLVVGVGINISLSDEDLASVGQPATDLRRLGALADRTTICAVVTERVFDALSRFEAEGLGGQVAEFDRHHALHGQICRVAQGDEFLEGTVRGIAADGCLLLETGPGKTERIASGEASLRRVSG